LSLLSHGFHSSNAAIPVVFRRNRNR
jgi:hypothetical protein